MEKLIIKGKVCLHTKISNVFFFKLSPFILSLDGHTIDIVNLKEYGGTQTNYVKDIMR